MGLPQPPDGSAPAYYGVYPALVTKIVDDQSLGRIQVRFPWLGKDGDKDVRAWATLCSPYADDNQGLEILPEVGSQVVVAFEAGNLRRPYIIGAAWNGKASLPQKPQESNDIRLLRTRSGSRLEFDDTSGSEKITLATQAGHEVILDTGGQTITVRHASGQVIKLTTTSIELTANLEVKVTAPILTVNAPISNFSGTVHCNMLVADSFVVSPAYTPGVGNLW